MSHQVTLDSILAIEHLLSDEEKQTRGAIRGWVRDRFLPTLTEHHRAGTFPTEPNRFLLFILAMLPTAMSSIDVRRALRSDGRF